jgi:hypothetical protein
MIGWILFITFLIYQVSEAGLGAALLGLGSAVGIDLIVAVVVGQSLSSIVSGAGLADDVIMMAFGGDLRYIERVALAIFADEAHHVEHEAVEYYDHTDYENERYSRWLQRKTPGKTYLFGDITPRDVIDLGLSGYVLADYNTFGTILDAAREKYGGLVTATADVIEIGGA